MNKWWLACPARPMMQKTGNAVAFGGTLLTLAGREALINRVKLEIEKEKFENEQNADLLSGPARLSKLEEQKQYYENLAHTVQDYKSAVIATSNRQSEAASAATSKIVRAIEALKNEEPELAKAITRLAGPAGRGD